MHTTKKMPCGLTKDGRLTPGSEFVIPHLDGRSNEGFRGLKSGEIYSQAGITYIGREVTAADILKKLPDEVPIDSAEAVLDKFVGALSVFKIGNVISIGYAEDGSFALQLERASVNVGERKKLP